MTGELNNGEIEPQFDENLERNKAVESVVIALKLRRKEPCYEYKGYKTRAYTPPSRQEGKENCPVNT